MNLSFNCQVLVHFNYTSLHQIVTSQPYILYWSAASLVLVLINLL